MSDSSYILQEHGGITTNNEAVNVNILGCCASRDAFNLPSLVRYEVKGYVQHHHPLLIFQNPCAEQYVLKEEDLDNHPQLYERFPELVHGFNRRMLRSLLNNSATELLLSNKGDWIVVDTWCFAKRMLQIQYPDESAYLMESDSVEMTLNVVKSLERYNGCTLDFRVAEPNITLLTERFADFLKQHWGSNIILINLKDARLAVGRDIALAHKEYRAYANLFSRLLVEKTGCHCISIPFEPTARDNVPVHYTALVERMIRDCVDAIVSASDRGGKLLNRLEAIYCKYAFFHSLIEIGDLQNFEDYEKQASDLIDRKSDEGLYQTLTTLKWIDSPYLSVFVAKVNQYGIGKEVDLDAAREWYGKAAANGLCKNEYYSLLLQNSEELAMKFAEHEACLGDATFMELTGKHYLRGSGVTKNLHSANRWLSAAYSKDEKRRIHYVTCLKEQGDYSKAIQVLERGVSEGDLNSMALLSTFYAQGLGLDRDLDRAEKLARAAAELSSNQIINLCDILLLKENPDLDEIVRLLTDSAATGNQSAQQRLITLTPENREHILRFRTASERPLRHLVSSTFD